MGRKNRNGSKKRAIKRQKAREKAMEEQKTLDDIAQRLEYMCPQCQNSHYDQSIEVTGKFFDKNAKYGAAETYYRICPECHYVYYHTL